MKKTRTALLLAGFMTVSSMGIYQTVWGAEKNLDDATKTAYYAEYQKIVEKVADKTDCDISLLPMEEFAQEDWIAPKDFQDLVTNLANWDIRCDTKGTPPTAYEGELAQEVIDTHNVAKQNPEDIFTIVAEKQVNVTGQEYSFPISVMGRFTTQYNHFTDRQEFSGVREITSVPFSTHQEKWIQTGYGYRFIDCGRTCVVTIFGKIEVAGIIMPTEQKVEFYCADTGQIA